LNRRKPARLAISAGAAAALVIGAQTVVQLVGITPASAAVQGIQRIPGQSQLTGSEPFKQAVATCPAGTRVLGGGARINVGFVGVVLTRLEPVQGTTDRYIAEAHETPTGTFRNWSLTAFAFCAPTSQLPGLQIFPATATGTGSFHTQAHARCPQGKAVIGGGGHIIDGKGQVDLSQIGRLFQVSAAGTTDLNGFQGPWSVKAFAVCVNSSVGSTVKVTDGKPVSAVSDIATCPSGKNATGAGVFTDVGSVVVAAEPEPAPGNVEGVVRQQEGSGSSFRVTAYCA
jgi:hypothetical protein